MPSVDFETFGSILDVDKCADLGAVEKCGVRVDEEDDGDNT